MKRSRLFLLGCLVMVTLLAVWSVGALSAASDDGMIDGRFVKTRHITVEVYDRNNPGGSDPEGNFYTDFIKEGMLRDHNVDVTFVPVPRWTEVEAINNLLAAGDAPDVCVTYSYATIQTYANMGGVLDMSPYLEKYKDLLPNLWDLLGDQNIYWDRDPETGTVWAIEARLFNNKRICTFVREDWLNKLGIPEPTTTQEFENMLRAFKANATLLLGADADKMIPYSTSTDVGWRNNYLLASFVPNNFSDKDRYIYGFDDRQLLFPGIKEGVRLLNKWYNEGLIWKDFPIYNAAGDRTEDNLIKSGYVGAFQHNWDYPYRNGEDSIAIALKKIVGPGAAFIAVDPFQNDAGVYAKYLPGPVDRKVFFPATNGEPLASLLYLDWISKLENRRFLQIGEEGVTHVTLADGTVKTLNATGDKIMNSPNNIDYTITINGLDLGDPEANAKAIALGYPGVDPKYVMKAYELANRDARYGKNVNVGQIMAEEGMGTALSAKRDNLFTQAIVAKRDQFDSVWDKGFKDYLNSGGQAIIDERRAKYQQYYE